MYFGVMILSYLTENDHLWSTCARKVWDKSDGMPASGGCEMISPVKSYFFELNSPARWSIFVRSLDSPAPTKTDFEYNALVAMNKLGPARNMHTISMQPTNVDKTKVLPSMPLRHEDGTNLIIMPNFYLLKVNRLASHQISIWKVRSTTQRPHTVHEFSNPQPAREISRFRVL